MTNEQETVADILREMRGHAKDGEFVNGYEVGRLADRIEAAHQREIDFYTEGHVRSEQNLYYTMRDKIYQLREVLKTITAEMCEQCRLAHPGETCVDGCEFLKMSKEVYDA